MIGAILEKPEICADMRSAGLEPEHFVSQYEQLAFIAICSVQDEGSKITFSSVSDRAKNIIQAEKRGSDLKMNPAHFEHYLKESINCADKRNPFNSALILKKEWDERILVKSCEKIISVVKSQQMDTQSVAISAIERFQKIFEKKNMIQSGYLDEAIDEVCDVYENGHRGAFVDTGMLSLDKVIIGWQIGELTVIAAATGQGKSGFVLNALHHQFKMKNKACLISLEMSKAQCMHRLISNSASIDNHKLIIGRSAMSSDEIRKATTHARSFHESDMIIFDPSRINFQELKNIISTQAKMGYKVFFVDQLSHVMIDNLIKIERYIKISTELKALAKHLKVAIVLLHQTSKASEKRSVETKGKSRPSDVDMRDAPIENDAAVVIILHRKEKYMSRSEVSELERGKVSVIVSKNRYGKSGYMNMYFQPQFSRIVDIDED